VTVFIDTAVIMYAAGADHPLRPPCRRIIAAVGAGKLEAVVSVEVVQEILHRYLSLRRPDIARSQATEVMDLFAPVVPISHALMRRVPDLAAAYPGLAARDLIHVATCIHEGIGEIISPDRAFDDVREVRRIDPAAFEPAPA